MSLSDVHPLYADKVQDWKDCRASYKGERHVKEQGIEYLPPTGAQELDGMGPNQLGAKSYAAYKLRARFPDYMRVAVQAFSGVLHQKPAKIELPAIMEPLRERATVSGEDLLTLIRRINEEQLTTGRLGLLADMPLVPDQTNPMPYLATYTPESIRNWDDSQDDSQLRHINLVVLDETGPKREGFTWIEQERYRVLQLGKLQENESSATYSQGVFEGKTYDESQMLPPALRGKTLNAIPFSFINSQDILGDPDEPPLLGLVRLCFAIYRSDADYRQNLYMQGQDTLVTIGLRNSEGSGPISADSGGDVLRTGAGARIDLDIDGDAKYIGVNSQGLAEQRQALEADHSRAQQAAGQLANAKSGANDESGEALRTRRRAQTATLKSIALTGAQGLQNVLRNVATWLGADPEEVIVHPNLEFDDLDMAAKELVDLMTARSMGAPLSLESIHTLCLQRGLTTKDFQDEMDIADEEIAKGLGQPQTPPVDPNATKTPPAEEE